MVCRWREVASKTCSDCPQHVYLPIPITSTKRFFLSVGSVDPLSHVPTTCPFLELPTPPPSPPFPEILNHCYKQREPHNQTTNQDCNEQEGEILPSSTETFLIGRCPRTSESNKVLYHQQNVWDLQQRTVIYMCKLPEARGKLKSENREKTKANHYERLFFRFRRMVDSESKTSPSTTFSPCIKPNVIGPPVYQTWL